MSRRRRNTPSQSTEPKQRKSIIDRIISHKEIIAIIPWAGAALYFIVNTLYKITYQDKCEKFYGIPGKYFDSSVDDRLLYLGLLIILLLTCIVPAVMKKHYEKKGNLTRGHLAETIFYSAIIGAEIGLYNVSNLIVIMKQTHKMNTFFRSVNTWLDDNAVITVWTVVILGVISIVGFTLINKLENIKSKWIRNAVHVTIWVSVAASVLVFIYGTAFRLSISVEDKTKYEFVICGDDEYVILALTDKKNLIVPFEIDEKGQYIFKTGQYLFLEQYEGMYQYRDIKYSPKIVSGMSQ